MRANLPLFLSHTHFTKKYFPAGMGEIANTLKLNELMKNSGYPMANVVDLFELFGPPEELFNSLALLNIELAYANSALIEEVNLDEIVKIRQKLLSYNPLACYILSYSWSLAALLSCSLHRQIPMAAKLYVHHAEDKIPYSLYEPFHFLITESELARTKAICEGVPAWKLLYIPHHYPKLVDHIQPDRTLVEALGQKLGKKVQLSEETLIIGVASRLMAGKNVEYALDVVEQLTKEGVDLIFILKGVLTANNPYEIWLGEKLQGLQEKNWFLWDESLSPLEEILKLYATFDVALQLTGAESASNTIVELLALGVATVVLDASTNPSLFSNAAHFVRKQIHPTRMTTLPFFRPDPQDLLIQVRELIQDASYRHYLKTEGKRIAKQRFNPELTVDRLPWFLQAPRAYFEGGVAAEKCKEAILRLGQEDQ